MYVCIVGTLNHWQKCFADSGSNTAVHPKSIEMSWYGEAAGLAGPGRAGPFLPDPRSAYSLFLYVHTYIYRAQLYDVK